MLYFLFFLKKNNKNIHSKIKTRITPKKRASTIIIKKSGYGKKK